MKTNVQTVTERTHEGAPAFPLHDPLAQLRRSVLSCLLFENEFYEDGISIAERVSRLSGEVKITDLADLISEARNRYHLRHVPLLMAVALIERGRGSPLVQKAIDEAIQRPDEMGELISLYWADGKRPLSAQLKKGLARAFNKFDAYQLAKWDVKSAAIKLRDVMFLVHPKPVSEEQSVVFKRLADGTLEPPDTWETGALRGADKRESFTRLISEGRLGYMALLRNLRNMAAAGVDRDLVNRAIVERKGAGRVLPFRYIAAARAAPDFEPALDTALQAAIGDLAPIEGKTVVLVDVSGSMGQRLSHRSDLTRMDAACALAAVLPSEDQVTYSFSMALAKVPPRRGMAMVDAIRGSQPHSGTYLGGAVDELNRLESDADRLIVVTDEQSHDRVPQPAFPHAYLINVASAKNGVGYGPWTHIDGFSERVIQFIQEVEHASDVRADPRQADR